MTCYNQLMLKGLKDKDFEEHIWEIKLPKLIFSCLLIIIAIFAGICCQINQTEQNVSYIKKYLAEKKGYYASLVSVTRRQVMEKYFGSQSKMEDFSDQFKTSFYNRLAQSPNQELKEGLVLMQLKYLNDYSHEIFDKAISLEDFQIQLNHFLDLRFAKQPKFSNAKQQILNNAAAKSDQLLSKEHIVIDPLILEAFLTPMVEIYYSSLISISHFQVDQNQNSPLFRLFILNFPIILFLIVLVIGYFSYPSVGSRLVIFCATLGFFFLAFLLQLPASHQNIDRIYSQSNLMEKDSNHTSF